MDGRTESGFGSGLGTAGKTTNYYYYGNTTKSCENVNQLVDREREKHTTNKHKSFPGSSSSRRERDKRDGGENQRQAASKMMHCA